MSEPTTGSFEEGLKRLESIVKRLEEGDLSLEQSLGLFEDGTHLTRELHATLEQAEKRIEILARDAGGGLRVEPFEPPAKG
jgi:exodeoxyribonuclease VII small subunit